MNLIIVSKKLKNFLKTEKSPKIFVCVCISLRVGCSNWIKLKKKKKKMSSDGGDGDDTVYGYVPGSVEPYVSFTIPSV